MKVCILTTSFPAYKGHLQSPFVYNLTKALAAKGAEVDVICPFYKNSKNKEEVIDSIRIHRAQYFFPLFFQKLTSKGGVAAQLKSSLISKLQLPFFMLSLLLKTRKYTKKCDVIHAQWALAALIGVFYKKLYKKPLVLTTRGADITMSLKSKLLRKILIYVLNNCDAITTICGDFKDQMVKLGIKPDKITRISNGIDSEFKPRDKELIRKRLKLPKDKKIILFVGWLIERKGIRYLVKAISPIIKKHKDTIFLIVGEGILKEELEKIIEKNNIKKNVFFLGSKNPNEIPYWMNAADIFILPTLSDGRPNTVIEAMACGVPTITTNVPGPSEVVENNKTGLLINSRSAKDIEKSIIKLLENSKLREKYAKAAANWIKTKGWTWEACADKYLSIYKGTQKNIKNNKKPIHL